MTASTPIQPVNATENGVFTSKPHSLIKRGRPLVTMATRFVVGITVALTVSLALGWYVARSMKKPAAMSPVKPMAVNDFKLPPLGWVPERSPPTVAPTDVVTPAGEPQSVAAVLTPETNPGVNEVTAAKPPILEPSLRSLGPISRVAGAPETAAPTDSEQSVLWRAHDQPTAQTKAPPETVHAGSLISAGYDPLLATQLPTGTRVLAKGTSLGCTLETAIESQLTGLVTCLIGTDVLGTDGRAVLLSRGSRLIGEARSEARAGQSRVFVLWAEARTPQGALVPIASPGTDALGRAGVPGSVDTHFFERFGAAMLISVLDAGIQAASSRGVGGTVVISPQASEAVITEILRNTVAIPPTINVKPGTHLTVLVARDVDFNGISSANGVITGHEQ